jgi:hypothetical protein
MRLWVRLGVTAALLVGMAIAVVHLRTETSRAGNRLHALYRRKRRLEKGCWRLHLAIADLKNVDRLREGAATFRAAGEGVEVLMDALPELAEPVAPPRRTGPIVPVDPLPEEPPDEPPAPSWPAPPAPTNEPDGPRTVLQFPLGMIAVPSPSRPAPRSTPPERGAGGRARGRREGP